MIAEKRMCERVDMITRIIVIVSKVSGLDLELRK